MNATPTPDARIPRPAYRTSSSGEVKLKPGSDRNGFEPNAARPIASAATELSTT